MKIGDKVVFIKPSGAYNRAATTGAEATIIGFERPYIKVKWNRETPYNDQNDGCYPPQEFVLKEFYYSPLYKAMNEN